MFPTLNALDDNFIFSQTILPRDLHRRFRFSLSLVTFFIWIELHDNKEAKELWVT